MIQRSRVQGLKSRITTSPYINITNHVEIFITQPAANKIESNQMKKEKFKALIHSGHKEAAAEVPFNPVVKWHIPAGQLWHGRRGYKVEGTLNGTAFESVIVPRARSFS